MNEKYSIIAFDVIYLIGMFLLMNFWFTEPFNSWLKYIGLIGILMLSLRYKSFSNDYDNEKERDEKWKSMKLLFIMGELL